MAGYTRNDTGNNIADGQVINASDFDGEYNAIEAAFDESTGHAHDGTAAEGPPITVVGPAQEYVASGTDFKPKTDDTYSLGTASNAWKESHVVNQLNKIYTLSGTSVALDPANGNVQTHALTGATTYTDSLANGEWIILLINDGSANTISSWPTITWMNNAGAAPTLSTTAYTVITVLKIGGTLYGILNADGT